MKTVVLTPAEKELLIQLRSSAEGFIMVTANGTYFRNARLSGVSMKSDRPRLFAALAGCLAKKNLYRYGDREFAIVDCSTFAK